MKLGTHSFCLLAMFSASSFSSIIAAEAQTIQPPLVNALDENNVNLASNLSIIQLPDIDISIGDESSGIGRVKLGRYDNFTNSIFVMPGPGSSDFGTVFARVSLAGKNYLFSVGNWYNNISAQAFNSGPYTEATGGPATLTCTTAALRGRQGTCTLATGENTRAIYDLSLGSGITNYHTSPIAYATSITKQDGEVITIANSQPGGIVYSASSSLGWMLKYQYGAGGSTTISLFNTSVEYCSPTPTLCSASYNHPVGMLVKSGTNGSITKNGAALTSYTIVGSSIAVSSPSGVTVSYQAGTPQELNQIPTASLTVTRGASVWRYSFEWPEVVFQSQYYRATAKRINPDLSLRTWKVDSGDNIYTYTDEGGRTTDFEYPHPFGIPQRLTKITRPGGSLTGGYTSFGYDNSGHLDSETTYPRDNFGQAPVIRSLTYGCSAQVCRDKPTQIVDARSKATDFEYDPDHGGLVKETGPADANGVRPQKRYSYTQLYPKVRDASGALVNSTPVYRVTRMSSCRMATAADPASCVGSADETVTTYAYGTNNLQRTSETVAAGDGSVSATTSYTYNNWGDVTSVNGPRTDVDDISYTTYDPQGRVIFEIGPDPDGASGTLKRLITKHHYDADWRDYLVQTGHGGAVDGSDFVATRFKRHIYSASTGLVERVEEGQP